MAHQFLFNYRPRCNGSHDARETKMCILPGGGKTSSTRLFSLPASADGVPDWRLVIYTNDMKVDKPGQNTLMIVPFPNPEGNAHVGLVAKNMLGPLCTAVQEVFKPYEYKEYTDGYEGIVIRGGGIAQSKAIVHKIGNYTCSVAPNLAALHTSIDWSAFQLPGDFGFRISVLTDTSIMPASAGFVIARANTNVENDGFGVVYPDDGNIFFPTCHEGGKARHNYDVNIYAAHTQEEHSIPLFSLDPVGRGSTDVVRMRVPMDGLANMSFTWADTGAAGELQLPEITHFTFQSFRATGPNKNLVCSADNAVVDMTSGAAVVYGGYEPVPDFKAYVGEPGVSRFASRHETWNGRRQEVESAFMRSSSAGLFAKDSFEFVYGGR